MTVTLRTAWVAIAGLLLATLLASPQADAHPEDCGGQHEPGDEHAPEEHEHDSGICFTEEEVAGFDDSGADLASGETARTRNVHLLANLPKQGPFEGARNYGSDLAFWGDYAFQGNYNGIQITDISSPDAPKVVSSLLCPGAQNDVSVWGNLLFTSTDSSRAFAECERDGVLNYPKDQRSPSAETWEGIRIFDWSDPANPTYVTAVETDCGSHTHTLLPDEANGRVLVYVSSYNPRSDYPDCQPPHDKISIVEVPLDDPASASVIAEPVLFPDGGSAGTSTSRHTDGCHDITVYQAIGLAAGACTGQGSILDISDPENPVEIARITDPNFVFWHSATFTHDGKRVVFTDELGGGGGPTCNPTVGPTRGANAMYDISDPTDPQFLSYFKIPRTQANSENCVAHNGVFLPTPDRDVYVQAWYQGGTSFIDWTDPLQPREIGFYDRGPFLDQPISSSSLGGSWSSYWYRGKAWSNDIQLGLDVFGFSDPSAAKAKGVKEPYLNAQTQMPLAKPGKRG